jgi:hypothetical protein
MLLARTAPIVVALSLAGIAAPPAGASTRDVTIGGCGWASAENLAAPGNYSGVIYDHSTTEGKDGLPTGATVTCKLQKNGIDLPDTTFSASGFGVQAGAAPISFTLTDSFDFVGTCQRTVYADGSVSDWWCDDGNLVFYFPPRPFNDVPQELDNVFEADLDPAACPVLAAHAGSYGPVTIAADGDVSVPDPLDIGVNPVYDCPPYIVY